MSGCRPGRGGYVSPVRAGRTLLGLVLPLFLSCGGPDGPPIPPRPATQTCLAGAPASLPTRLSRTGCFVTLSPLRPGPDLVPYDVSAELWTDGADKRRFLVVPPGEAIEVGADGAFSFPEGSVLVKVFLMRLAGGDGRPVPVETRFMLRRADGWEFFTYRWNAAGTDADLLDDQLIVDLTVRHAGAEVTVPYLFPGRETCTVCHGDAAGRALGPRAEQLDAVMRYPGGASENQLVALAGAGLLRQIDPAAVAALPALPDPADARAPLEERARAWLHTNCAHCHRPGGWAPPDLDLDLRWQTPFAQTATCDEWMLYHGGRLGRLRVEPGAGEASGIWIRMTTESELRMPPVGSSIVDPVGERVVREWIDSLTGCPE